MSGMKLLLLTSLMLPLTAEKASAMTYLVTSRRAKNATTTFRGMIEKDNTIWDDVWGLWTTVRWLIGYPDNLSKQ